MVPGCSARKMSPGASSCVATPIFAITFAPGPKNRIFRSSRSAALLISLPNQPEASGGMTTQGRLWIPCLPNISRASWSPPPWYIQARYSPNPGPNGTVANRVKAESVPANNPAPDQAASTEPCETAWIACNAGDSARAHCGAYVTMLARWFQLP
jgi:hypothetical protein